MRRCSLLSVLLLGIVASVARAAPPAAGGPVKWVDTGPPPGIYIHWYEPSFYAGFAPRCQEPDRIHVHLGRGNQLRVTLVLGTAQIDGYLEDLLYRRDMYRKLVDQKAIELTQNRQLEAFEARIEELGVEGIVKSKGTLGLEGYRKRSLEVMDKLLPGRLRHVQFPMDATLAAWRARLRALPVTPSPQERVDAADGLLPERLSVHDLGGDLDAALSAAVAGASGDDARFREAALSFLAKASHGHYAITGNAIEAWELTSIYPAGTEADTVTYKGIKLPDFGLTGVCPLIPRKHGKGVLGIVDYIATNPAYGYLPNLGYQYAGGIAYNSYHNAAVRTPLGTPFIPDAWRKAPPARDPKKPYMNLWLACRGPISHGCTRLPSGQISELRHVQPSASEKMQEVLTFRNLPQCYDVFDVDGDGKPEVMGIRYYIAFKAREDRTPYAAVVENRRDSFYRHLYGDDLEALTDQSARLRNVLACDFVGKKALEGRVYPSLPVYEPDMLPEPIQFYRPTRVTQDSAAGHELIREIDRIGLGYEPDWKKLGIKP